MSDQAKLIRDTALHSLENMGDDLADDFVDGLKEILKGADTAARKKIVMLIKDGFDFKRKALSATSQAVAREYAAAAEKSARRVKTVLLAESLVAQEETAALVSALFGKALDGLASVAKTVVVAIAKELAKAVVDGITGEEGDGFDSSSIFPFA